MRWFVPVLILVAFVRLAAADTGGSMGGGDWGGGGGGGGYSGGGGGGYSSGGDYSSSSGGSSPSYSYSGGTSPGTGFGGAVGAGVLGLMIVCGMIGAVAWAVGEVKSRFTPEPSYFSDEPMAAGMLGEVDVSVVRIAIDGRARKFVQSELTRIAQLANTGTADGRATMLREVCLLLRRVRESWVYGGAVNFDMGAMSAMKTTFDQQVDDARSRFREETIRNAQGQITRTAASDYTPRSAEGAGLILISIILAARTELYTVTRIADGEDLRQALDALGHLLPATLVAVEIVWQPSEDSDRLSSVELEAKYPRPDLIPIQGSLVGKTFCTHCGAPFPAELLTCPHCGAPAPGRDAPAASA
jgi:uncharacterized membrane protein